MRDAGATLLRGGAFKPRSSPHSFQGLGEEGLRLLREAGQQVGLPVVTEVLDTHDVELVCRYADMLQIGARNMQNFALLRRVGESGHPVLLKRGPGSKIKDLLMAAEYIMVEGNEQVVLCERGITTFEDAARYTTDINAVPILKEMSHLPVILDPSHSTGDWRYVTAIARAAIAAGADGLIVEVHPDPSTRARTASSRSSRRVSPNWCRTSPASGRLWIVTWRARRAAPRTNTIRNTGEGSVRLKAPSVQTF